MEKQTFSEKKACFSASEQKIIQILLYFVITLPYNKKWNTLLLCPPGGHPIKWEEIIMANEKILVVDDDTNICELLRLYLTKEGYQVTVANDGEEGLEKFNQVKPDMVLLDVMMPKMDGLEVCRRIRKAGNTPVMMLTAKGETFDKVLGLELGADDYMVKPFDAKEVVARIKAVLRRCTVTTSQTESSEGVIEFDNLRLDMNSYELRVKGKVVEAPPKELELLPLGAKIITLELAVRFLTDYLDGDRYFRVAYPEHNLVRARAQMKLVADMEAHWDEMQAIVAEEAAKRN